MTTPRFENDRLRKELDQTRALIDSATAMEGAYNYLFRWQAVRNEQGGWVLTIGERPGYRRAFVVIDREQGITSTALLLDRIEAQRERCAKRLEKRNAEARANAKTPEQRRAETAALLERADAAIAKEHSTC